MTEQDTSFKNKVAIWYKNVSLITIPVGVFLLILSILTLVITIEDKIIVYLISALLTVFLTATVFVIWLIATKRKNKVGRNDDLADVFVNEFIKMNKARSLENSMLAEFGSLMAKNLYLSSCYKERLEIANIVLDIAKEMNNDVLIAQTLIYDIGWTEALYGKIDLAREHILEGIKKIEGNKDQKALLITAKGLRYLGSLSVANKNAKNADLYFQKAMDVCQTIQDKKVQERFLAGIYFAIAERFLYIDINENNLEKALEYALKSKEMREAMEDSDRKVRSYAQIGKIRYFAIVSGYLLSEYNNDSFESIKSFFQEGLNEAKETMRIDEIKKNTYGLACCLLRMGRKEHKREVLSRISSFNKTYGDVELFVTDDELVEEYKRVLGGRL